MKKQIILLFSSFLLVAGTLQAQYSTQGFSFQGYAIDADSKALASTGITVRFTISRTGTSYVEEHTTTTDAFGVFSASIGEGSSSSSITFGELDFNNFDFNLKVEVKETSGGTYTTISDRTLSAVPYARAAANGVPVGTIVAFAGPASAIPDGWLLCDGTTLNSSTNLEYSQLFNVIGITWGGTANTDFRVPDLRGMFLRGVNGTRSDSFADSNTSRTLGSTQWYQTARPANPFSGTSNSAGNHTHPVSGYNLFGGGTQGGSTTTGTALSFQVPNTGAPTGAHTHNTTITAGGDPETSPKNAAVHYIIKY